MRIMDLFSIAKEYLLVGIIAVAVFAIVIAIGYFWVYKKCYMVNYIWDIFGSCITCNYVGQIVLY